MDLGRISPSPWHPPLNSPNIWRLGAINPPPLFPEGPEHTNTLIRLFERLREYSGEVSKKLLELRERPKPKQIASSKKMDSRGFPTVQPANQNLPQLMNDSA
jgi:hypothetical protein